MGSTNRYGLRRMGPGDAFSGEGYQFTDADRVLIDELLHVGAETHRHTGQAPAAAATPAQPGLTVLNTGGAIPAGSRVHYKYTLVDGNGLESSPTVETYADTPAAVLEPGAPALVVGSTGGTLLPGNYAYVLSAYTNGANTQETKAIAPAFITVPVGTLTNRIILTLPTLPAGANGWNVYRRRPGSVGYYYLTSLAGTAGGFTDTGSLTEDCNRSTPIRNVTNNQNSIRVTLPTAVPVGSTWKAYRSYVSGAYDNTMLHHVVEETAEGSGVITTTYLDQGLATFAGKPPAVGVALATPSQIDLTDSVEVKGGLPLARVSAFPEIVVFSFEGLLSPRQGTSLWVCEYPGATIMAVRAALGRGYAPAATPVVVDVNWAAGEATPTFASIFAATADQPQIPVAHQRSTRMVPTAKRELVEGDMLSADIDVSGGGASPTDADLTIMIYVLVHGYTSALSHVPATI